MSVKSSIAGVGSLVPGSTSYSITITRGINYSAQTWTANQVQIVNNTTGWLFPITGTQKTGQSPNRDVIIAATPVTLTLFYDAASIIAGNNYTIFLRLPSGQQNTHSGYGGSSPYGTGVVKWTDYCSVALTAPASTPGAPTGVTATPGDVSASVSFTAPASSGGSAITSYTVTSSPGGLTQTGASSPLTVTGLTNGTAYTFTVTATNTAGAGAVSSASTAVTPRTVPGAPTIGTATPGNVSASVSFTAPASNGGSAITSYTVTSSPGDFTGTGSGSSITVSGLTNGTAYTFTVTATNVAGAGAASGASTAVTPRTVPGAPTEVTATPGNGSASVSFTAPASTGGSAITSYTVTSSPGGFTGTGADDVSGSSITVSGLTNGTAYTFTVTATNAAGTGTASEASTAVTPRTVPGAPTIGTATPGDGSASVSFTAPASTGGSVITGYTVTSSPGGFTGTGSGSSITVSGLTNGTAYTFTVTATNAAGAGEASSASTAVTPSIFNTLSPSLTSSASSADVQSALATAASSTLTSVSFAGKSDAQARASLLPAVADVITTVQTRAAAATAGSAAASSVGVAIIELIKAANTLYKQSGVSIEKATVSQAVENLSAISIDATDSAALLATLKPELVSASLVGKSFSVEPAKIGAVVGGVSRYILKSTAGNNAPYQYTPMIPDEWYNLLLTSEVNGAGVPAPPVGAVISQLKYNADKIYFRQSSAATVQELAIGNSYSFIRNSRVYTYTVDAIGTVVDNYNSPAPCIPTGQRILTVSGWRAVEDLLNGDMVVTDTGAAVPAVIYTTTLTTCSKTAPITIPGKAGAPSIRLSPNHAVRMNNHTWQFPSNLLKSRADVTQDAPGQEVTYYHIALPNYLRDNLVLEGGVVAESFGSPFVKANGLQHAKFYTYNKRLDGFTRMAAGAVATKSA